MFPFIPAIPSFMAAISSAIGSIGSFVATYGPTIVKTLDTVQQVVSVVAKTLDILEQHDSVSEIGEKALQAVKEEIYPESFDNYHDYLEYIRNFELNPEFSTEYTAEEKALTGIAIVAQALEEKLGLPKDSMGVICGMVALNSAYFTAERLLTYVNAGLDLGKVAAYFSKMLNPVESFKTESELIELDKSNRSEHEVVKELEQVKTELYQAAQQ